MKWHLEFYFDIQYFDLVSCMSLWCSFVVVVVFKPLHRNEKVALVKHNLPELADDIVSCKEYFSLFENEVRSVHACLAHFQNVALLCWLKKRKAQSPEFAVSSEEVIVKMPQTAKQIMINVSYLWAATCSLMDASAIQGPPLQLWSLSPSLSLSPSRTHVPEESPERLIRLTAFTYTVSC